MKTFEDALSIVRATAAAIVLRKNALEQEQPLSDLAWQYASGCVDGAREVLTNLLAGQMDVQIVERPNFQGGRGRSVEAMIRATAALRDEGGLTGSASLIFSQLLLNLAGKVGRVKAALLMHAFLEAAAAPMDPPRSS